jgi:ribonuclease PH
MWRKISRAAVVQRADHRCFRTGVGMGTCDHAGHAEGSCLVRKFGDTHVLCTASVEEKRAASVLAAQHRQGLGDRRIRHAAALDPHAHAPRGGAGKQGGRTQEIQRLIGRSLRAVVDLQALGERRSPSTAT